MLEVYSHTLERFFRNLYCVHKCKFDLKYFLFHLDLKSQ